MAGLTARGAATRERIVHTATDLVLERGVGGMTLDEIRAGTATSKSQLFHYFPGGKSDLVEAIAAYQMSRVLAAQQPWLDHLDSWPSWLGWRDAVIAHYRGLTHKHCSISAMVNEVAEGDPSLAAAVAVHADNWYSLLAAGTRRMRDGGLLSPGTDTGRLAMTIFTALQGGLVVMRSKNDLAPLEAALDGALAALESHRI